MTIRFHEASLLSIFLLAGFLIGMYTIWRLWRQLRQYKDGNTHLERQFSLLNSRIEELNTENDILNAENGTMYNLKSKLERKLNATNFRVATIEKMLGVEIDVPFEEATLFDRRTAADRKESDERADAGKPNVKVRPPKAKKTKKSKKQKA